MAIFNIKGFSTAPVNTIVDEGWYHVQIIEAKGVISREKQTPGIEINVSVLNGPVQQATGTVPYGKRVRSTIWVNNQIGQSQLAKICKILGIPQNDDMDLDQFTGREILAKVGHEEYNGEDRERFTGWKSTDELAGGNPAENPEEAAQPEPGSQG